MATLGKKGLKDQVRVGQWEDAVQKCRKNGKEWQATHHSFLCSKHFEIHDYTLLPSSTGTCRLKSNAIPTIFKILPTSNNIPDEAMDRLEMNKELSEVAENAQYLKCHPNKRKFFEPTMKQN